MASETYNRIQEAIKNAMKSSDPKTRDTLRMVVSDVKNKTINEGKEITEDIVLSCLKKSAKMLEDSIESAKMAGRADLEEKARSELVIVSAFLPTMVPADQLPGVIGKMLVKIESDIGRALTKKDFGIVMKSLPADCDRKLCAKLLQGMLS